MLSQLVVRVAWNRSYRTHAETTSTSANRTCITELRISGKAALSRVHTGDEIGDYSRQCGQGFT